MESDAKGSGSKVEFEVIISPRMEERIKKIKNHVIYNDIDRTIKLIEQDPYAGIELTGELWGLRRIKAVRRTFRIVYEIHETNHELLIVQVVHHKVVYEELKRFWPGRNSFA